MNFFSTKPTDDANFRTLLPSWEKSEEQIDQCLTSFNSRYTFSAKEKDIETGYSYFGARYYNSDLSIWLSVDPMSDKYPSLSPYVYCNNNPVILVDPDGMEICGDYFNWYGKYLGTDGKKDNNVFFVSDRKSIKTIRDNDKAGGSTDARSVKVDLSTTKSVLQEIVGVNSRTEDNGNTREEATITNSTGGRYTGQGPDIRTLKWDEVPDGTIDVTGDIDVTIHSHLSFIRTNPDGSGEIKASSALRPSTKDNRIKANLNVITGPLGDPTWVGTPEGRGSWNMPSQGAFFYDSNWKPIGGITIDALQNILKH